MKIDAHAHFWKYEKQENDWRTGAMKVLQEDYLPGKLGETFRRNGIDGCVAVQVEQTELETHFLIELAHANEMIKGVVGWVDFRKDDIATRLHHFSTNPIVKGWRHIVQSESGDFLLRKDFQHGISLLQEYNYSYDLLIYHHQLKQALSFVAGFPQLPVVLDHCGKPDIAHKKIDGWKLMMRDMAQHPNVYCKLSGLFTEAKWKEWTPGEFYPYLDIVFEAFGTDRLMFGSDWPVILVSGIYVQWKSLLEKYMENMKEEEKENFFGGNAIRFYRLMNDARQ